MQKSQGDIKDARGPIQDSLQQKNPAKNDRTFLKFVLLIERRGCWTKNGLAITIIKVILYNLF